MTYGFGFLSDAHGGPWNGDVRMDDVSEAQKNIVKDKGFMPIMMSLWNKRNKPMLTKAAGTQL